MSPVSAPSVQRLGDAVLLQGQALAEVRHLLAIGLRERERRDAMPPSSGLRFLLAVISEAIAEGELLMSSPRHRSATLHAALTDSPMEEAMAEMTSDQVAAVLGVGRRQAQRLAGSIGSRRLGGVLVFDAGAVQSFAASRQRKDHHPHGR